MIQKDCQYRVYEFSLTASWCVLLFSCYVMSDFFVTPCNVAHKAPLSLGFARQEYWSRWLFPSPGHPPKPRDQTHICYTGRQALIKLESAREAPLFEGSPCLVQASYWCRYFINLLVLVWGSCEHAYFVTEQFTPSWKNQQWVQYTPHIPAGYWSIVW